MCGLSISRAPLQASTSSSCARSGKPSRTRNSSSFHNPPPDLHIAGATLRAEWPEPRQLVAALGCRPHREAAQRPHQMLRLALAGLPRILPEPDRDPLSVLRGGIEQQLFDVARVGARPHHIQYPIVAAPIAAE